MSALKLMGKWGVPVATAVAVPLFGPAVFADSGSKDSTKTATSTSRMIRPSELPIYEEPEEVLDFEYHGRERTALEDTVGGVRHEIEGILESTRAAREKVVHICETGKAHTMASLDYIADEDNVLPRVGAITIGGLAGLVLGARKKGGLAKKAFYTTAGVTGAASLCYPRQAYQLSQQAYGTVKEYGNIGYNFVAGVKPQSKVAAPEAPKKEEPPAEPAPEAEATPSTETPSAETAPTESEGDEVRTVLPQAIPDEKFPAPVDSLAQESSDVVQWGFRLTDKDSTAPSDPSVPEGFGAVREEESKVIVEDTTEVTVPEESSKEADETEVSVSKDIAEDIPEKAPETEGTEVSVSKDIAEDAPEKAPVVKDSEKETDVIDTMPEIVDKIAEDIGETVGEDIVEDVAVAVREVTEEALESIEEVAKVADIVENVTERVSSTIDVIQEVLEKADKAAEEAGLPDTLIDIAEVVVEGVERVVDTVNVIAGKVEDVAEAVVKEVEELKAEAVELTESEEKREEMVEKIVDFIKEITPPPEEEVKELVKEEAEQLIDEKAVEGKDVAEPIAEVAEPVVPVAEPLVEKIEETTEPIVEDKAPAAVAKPGLIDNLLNLFKKDKAETETPAAVSEELPEPVKEEPAKPELESIVTEDVLPVVEKIAEDIVEKAGEKVVEEVAETVVEVSKEVEKEAEIVAETAEIVDETGSRVEKIVEVIEEIAESAAEAAKAVPGVPEIVEEVAEKIEEISKETEVVIDTVTAVAKEVEEIAEEIVQEAKAVELEAAELVASEEKREELVEKVIEFVSEKVAGDVPVTQDESVIEKLEAVVEPPQLVEDKEEPAAVVKKEGLFDKLVNMFKDKDAKIEESGSQIVEKVEEVGVQKAGEDVGAEIPKLSEVPDETAPVEATAEAPEESTSGVPVDTTEVLPVDTAPEVPIETAVEPIAESLEEKTEDKPPTVSEPEGGLIGKLIDLFSKDDKAPSEQVSAKEEAVPSIESTTEAPVDTAPDVPIDKPAEVSAEAVVESESVAESLPEVPKETTVQAEPEVFAEVKEEESVIEAASEIPKKEGGLIGKLIDLFSKDDKSSPSEEILSKEEPSQGELVTESVESTPVVSVETAPELPGEITPEVPVETAPEVLAEITPEVPVETAPEAPAEITPEVPVETAPEVPVEITPEVLVETAPEAPAEITPEVPVETAPEVPAEITPEVSVETAPEVPAEPEVLPEQKAAEAIVEATSEIQKKEGGLIGKLIDLFSDDKTPSSEQLPSKEELATETVVSVESAPEVPVDVVPDVPVDTTPEIPSEESIAASPSIEAEPEIMPEHKAEEAVIEETKENQVKEEGLIGKLVSLFSDDKASPPEQISVDSAPEVPVEITPEVPVDAASEVPVEPPEIPVATTPEIPVDAPSEESVAVTLPVEAEPEALPEPKPEEAIVEATSEVQKKEGGLFGKLVDLFSDDKTPSPEQVSVDSTPEVPVEIAPDVPADAVPEVAVDVTPDVPVEVTSEIPVATAPEIPVDTPEESVEVPLTVQAEPEVLPEQKAEEAVVEATSEIQKKEGGLMGKLMDLFSDDKTTKEELVVEPVAPVESAPEVPQETTSEITPEVPVDAEPEVPVDTVPEVPVDVAPEIPVDTTPEVPVETPKEESSIEVLSIQTEPESLPEQKIEEPVIETVPETEKNEGGLIGKLIDFLSKDDESEKIVEPAVEPEAAEKNSAEEPVTKVEEPLSETELVLEEPAPELEVVAEVSGTEVKEEKTGIVNKLVNLFSSDKVPDTGIETVTEQEAATVAEVEVVEPVSEPVVTEQDSTIAGDTAQPDETIAKVLDDVPSVEVEEPVVLVEPVEVKENVDTGLAGKIISLFSQNKESPEVAQAPEQTSETEKPSEEVLDEKGTGEEADFVIVEHSDVEEAKSSALTEAIGEESTVVIENKDTLIIESAGKSEGLFDKLFTFMSSDKEKETEKESESVEAPVSDNKVEVESEVAAPPEAEKEGEPEESLKAEVAETPAAPVEGSGGLFSSIGSLFSKEKEQPVASTDDSAPSGTPDEIVTEESTPSQEAASAPDDETPKLEVKDKSLFDKFAELISNNDKKPENVSDEGPESETQESEPEPEPTQEELPQQTPEASTETEAKPSLLDRVTSLFSKDSEPVSPESEPAVSEVSTESSSSADAKTDSSDEDPEVFVVLSKPTTPVETSPPDDGQKEAEKATGWLQGSWFRSSASVSTEGKDVIIQVAPEKPEKDYGQANPEDADMYTTRS